MTRMKLKKGDEVEVIYGKEKGKKGKVLKTFPQDSRALVEGLNRVKRHTKPSRTDQHGGIKEKESPLPVSSLMFLCPACNKTTRLGKKTLDSGERVRFCKKCNAILDK